MESSPPTRSRRQVARQLQKLILGGLVLSLGLTACKDEPAPSLQTPSSLEDVLSEDHPPKDVAPEDATPELEPEPEPQELVLLPQLRVLSESITELDKRLKSPVGNISGELYGPHELLGITRTSCGEGVLIQPIFRGTKGLQIGVPVRLELGELATTSPVRYRDGEFDVEAHFTEDSKDRVKGTIQITHNMGATKRTLVKFDVDTAPIEGQLPPTLDGQKNLPFYVQCTPNGYFRVQAASKTFRGYANVQDIGQKAAPLITLPLTPYDRLEFFFIPPRPNQEYEDPIQFDLKKGGQQGDKPVVLMSKIIQMRPVVEPSEATGRNLGVAREATILDGTANVTLVKKGKRWHVSMQLENLRMPDGIKGPLENIVFERIEIDGILGDGSTTPTLGDAPDWWTGDSND